MSNINKKGDFLQSAEWRAFQEAVGRKAYLIESEGFSASIIEHVLPIVGKYFYCPRGPVLNVTRHTSNVESLIELAKKENAGWIRIEPQNSRALDFIGANWRVVKAPHDMQPKEIFVMDISKSEEQLLSEMKSKTRYNIGVAKKKGVKVISHQSSVINSEKNKYIDDFLRLTREMASRQGITAHPEEHYRKMIESLPEEMLKIYVAEFEGPASTRGDDCSPASTQGESTRGGKVLAANLMIFFGETATYLHGASSNENRNVMAPFLLQWQAILDAKEAGHKFYDFGGISESKWPGITNFKLGFSPSTAPIVFPGTYDIIINSRKYAVYRGLQRAKAMIHNVRK